ncbi:MAG TPA: selenium cofactor biosynthesis protein YqeC [Ktedonobacteraceae bacterium]|nr:selenium cofactor biosynthesis protein YqeC [Ktedonobacteraceae bacterium]
MPLLADLIDLPSQPLISMVGAGGKTTTMYTLARELAWQGKRVITTTTTQIFTPGADETEMLIVEAETSRLLDRVMAAWQPYQRITVASSVNERGKLFGIQPDIPSLLFAQGGADAVIIEADGARHRMIKAPADYEPVVPSATNVALLLMSAEAINQPLSEAIAHRPERIAAVSGITMGEMLTPDVVARLMTSEQGALKGIPENAKAYVLVTHTTDKKVDSIRELARLVMDSPRIMGTRCSERAGEWFIPLR